MKWLNGWLIVYEAKMTLEAGTLQKDLSREMDLYPGLFHNLFLKFDVFP